MFRHRASIILFEGIARELWKFHPEILADQVFATPVEQLLRLPIDEREFPIPVHRKKSVTRFFQDVRHFSDRLLQFRACLIALSQRTNASLRYRKPDIQEPRVDWFGQIIVGARFQRLFQVLRVIACRDQKNEEFLAVRRRTQFAA